MLGPLAPSAAADPGKGEPRRCRQWVGRPKPKGHLPITWQANTALWHLTLAAPHTSSSIVPFQQGAQHRGLSLPTLSEICAGEGGGVWVRRHTHGAVTA